MTHAGTPELPAALWRNPEPKRAYDVVPLQSHPLQALVSELLEPVHPIIERQMAAAAVEQFPVFARARLLRALDRFTTGAPIDEHGAAAVAHRPGGRVQLIERDGERG